MQKNSNNSLLRPINITLLYLLSLIGMLMPAGLDSGGTGVSLFMFLGFDILGNAKVILLLLLIVLNIQTIIMFFINIKNVFYTFFAVIFPIMLFVISVCQVNFSDVASGLYVFLFIWLIPVIKKYRIDYLTIAINVLLIMTFIIDVSALLDFTGIMAISANPALNLLNDTGNAQVSKSVNAIFLYVIFLKASPMLLILLTNLLFKKRYVIAFFAMLALLFSGTRANIYIAILLVVLYFFIYIKKPVLKIMVIGALAIFMVRFGPSFIDKVNVINSVKSTGDAVRSSSVQEIFESMNQNPISYLLGSGIGSEYYSLARGGFITGSELSYLEFFRQTGMFGFMTFLIFIFNPLIKLFKSEMWLFCSYFGYLVISITEPFLFTSTGFIMYLLVYSMIDKEPYLIVKAKKV